MKGKMVVVHGKDNSIFLGILQNAKGANALLAPAYFLDYMSGEAAMREISVLSNRGYAAYSPGLKNSAISYTRVRLPFIMIVECSDGAAASIKEAHGIGG